MGMRFTSDGHELRHLSRVDPVLRPLLEQIGSLEHKLREDRLAALARAIVGQQLSSAAASTIWNRLSSNLGDLNSKAISDAGVDRLREFGISSPKASYIVGLAEMVESGVLDLDGLDSLSDCEVIEVLVKLRGVGRWTAKMFLIFSLGRMDVFSADDAALRAVMRRLYGLSPDELTDTFCEIAETWRPYRTVASLYMWRSLDVGV